MGIEIERKFLLKNESWRLDTSGRPRRGTLYRQGYLSRNPACIVRLRLEGDEAFITLKGRRQGVRRSEYQYPVPASDCAAMLEELADKPLIEKTRYKVDFDGLTWEIDEFHGENAGLLVAEVELESEDQAFKLPPWAGEEVSGDSRYANAALVNNPFRNWKK
ncbi:MAG: CYTH domain-containing protein [Deltaproteobacteria bacterium]|jgi:adenylate cyclase|nr:CYTH domain-containing protein [Deltaproteobacteria bacterium]